LHYHVIEHGVRCWAVQHHGEVGQQACNSSVGERCEAIGSLDPGVFVRPIIMGERFEH
jgi:hypothetical protein